MLFDADNIAPAKAGAILASVRELGSVRFVRAYGDFFQTHLAGWRPAMIAHAIRAHQVTTVMPGKDTVDHAIVADAITLAYTTDITTMVIVSSDSDFVDLALRLREIGLSVHGYGERKTLSAMVTAYDRFVYLEDLPARTAAAQTSRAAAPVKAAKPTTKPKTAAAPKPKTGGAEPLRCAGLPDTVAASVCEVVNALAKKNSCGADLATVCHRLHAKGITAQLPESTRVQLGRFLKECGLFDVDEQENGNSKHIYLRTKTRHR